MVGLRRILREDLPRLRRFWRDHWAGEQMIVHGEVFHPEQLEGFVTADWSGLVTYIIRGHECEIVSLDSLVGQRGIGTALIDAVANEARRHTCGRVCLTTTNDNLTALGFFQRRGFSMAALRRGAVNEARLRKPAIPLVGESGIRLHDEIELELRLQV